MPSDAPLREREGEKQTAIQIHLILAEAAGEAPRSSSE
jgi:hypothetical protein